MKESNTDSGDRDKSDSAVGWVVACLNGLLSGILANRQIPIRSLAGFETPSLVIAFVIGLLGARLGFHRFRGAWMFVAVQGALFVAAMIQYQQLQSLGGLQPFQKYEAIFLYAYLFFSGFHILAFCQRGLKNLKGLGKPPKTGE